MKATVEQKPPPRLSERDEQVVPPPSSATVDFERKPLLYLPDGKVLVRRAGF